MEKEVLEVLRTVMPGVDFEGSESLVDDGIIDSLALISIIAELSEHFGIDVPLEELDKENFNSLSAIVELVERHYKG